jgi:hypothetical protein
MAKKVPRCELSHSSKTTSLPGATIGGSRVVSERKEQLRSASSGLATEAKIVLVDEERLCSVEVWRVHGRLYSDEAQRVRGRLYCGH